MRWCSDGLELSCDNGERVRVAFALDCCDREIMSWVATTKGIDAALVGDLIMQAVESRFGPNTKPHKPIEWLTDNGSCYTAAETRSFAKQLGLKPVTTPVTSPQSNGMAESCPNGSMTTILITRTARWATCHQSCSGRSER